MVVWSHKKRAAMTQEKVIAHAFSFLTLPENLQLFRQLQLLYAAYAILFLIFLNLIIKRMNE